MPPIQRHAHDAQLLLCVSQKVPCLCRPRTSSICIGALCAFLSQSPPLASTIFGISSRTKSVTVGKFFMTNCCLVETDSPMYWHKLRSFPTLVMLKRMLSKNACPTFVASTCWWEKTSYLELLRHCFGPIGQRKFLIMSSTTEPRTIRKLFDAPLVWIFSCSSPSQCLLVIAMTTSRQTSFLIGTSSFSC